MSFSALLTLAPGLFLQAPTQEHILFTSDKIYAVLTVVLIVWLGVLVQLFRVETKLRKLENHLEELPEEMRRQ